MNQHTHSLEPAPVRRSMLLMMAVLVLSAACLPATGLRAQTADQDGPAQLLEERGLVRSGQVWVTPVEAELQESLLSVRKQDAELRGLTRRFNQLLTENNQQLAIVNKARAEVVELGRRIDSGTLNVKQTNELTLLHNQRVDFINEVGPLLYDAEGKVNNLPLAQLQQKRMELRNSLIEKLLQIDRIAGDIESSYEPYAQDEEITAAIAEIGRSRLGPAKSYETDLGRLTRARHNVMTGANPINREDEDFRVWGVVNETTGLLFTYNPDCHVTLLAAADAELLNLEVPEDAAEESVRVSEDKQVTGRLTKLASLRLGDQILTDVPCYVLGDKDADLGSVLGAKSFGNATVDFQPQLLLLNISGAEAEAEPETADGQGK